MSEKLKLCKCGGKAVLVTNIVDYFGAKVICTDCGVTMSICGFSKESSVKEVIEKWNRRAE